MNYFKLLKIIKNICEFIREMKVYLLVLIYLILLKK